MTEPTTLHQLKLLWSKFRGLVTTNKKAHLAMDSFIGRHSHMLLELFKYITENPEPSELLLEQLRTTRPSKSQLVEGLVF